MKVLIILHLLVLVMVVITVKKGLLYQLRMLLRLVTMPLMVLQPRSSVFQELIVILQPRLHASYVKQVSIVTR